MVRGIREELGAPLLRSEFYDSGVPIWVECRPVDGVGLTMPLHPEIDVRRVVQIR